MSVNKIILVGRLGKDPEEKKMTNGESVTNVTLATSENWKDKTGTKQEKTEWHNLVFYRRLAEIAGQYLKKGSQIYVEGKIQTRKWQDKEGQDRYMTEVVVNEMQMLGGKAGSQLAQPTSQAGGQKDDADLDIPFGENASPKNISEWEDKDYPPLFKRPAVPLQAGSIQKPNHSPFPLPTSQSADQHTAWITLVHRTIGQRGTSLAHQHYSVDRALTI